MFQSVSLCFRLFQSVSVCFTLLQSVSVCFSLFPSVSVCFSLFQSVSVCSSRLSERTETLPFFPLRSYFVYTSTRIGHSHYHRTVRRVRTLLWRTVPYVPYRAVHAVPYHAERTAKPRAAHMISISSTSHHRLLTAGYIFNVISPPKKFSGSSLRLMFFCTVRHGDQTVR